jgi:phage regulator Rha-like protein
MWRRPAFRADVITLARIGVAAAAYVAEFDELKRELAEVRRERDELRERILDMLATRRALREATAAVEAARRRHDIDRAQHAMRDPASRLH